MSEPIPGHPHPRVSFGNYYMKSKTTNTLAILGLRISGVLVAAIFMGITGYIIFNGLITRIERYDAYLSYGTHTFPVDNAGTMQAAIVVARRLTLHDINYSQLRALASGNDTYLGFITGKNLNAKVAVLGDEVFRKTVREYLMLGEGYDAPLKAASLSSNRQAMEFLRQNKGAIIIGQGTAEALTSRETLGSAAKSIPLREAAVVINATLAEQSGGRTLKSLRHADIENVLDGSIVSWSELGSARVDEVGATLPVATIRYADDAGAAIDPLQRTNAGQDPSRSRLASDAGEFALLVASTPGAIGVVRGREALLHGLTTMEIVDSRWSWNITPARIIDAPSRAGAVGGLSTIIINTIILILAVLFIAVPIGVSAAIYLVHYGREGLLYKMFRLGTDTLAGIPSILFGLFGMVFFSTFLGFKTGLVSGSLTLALMILPTIIRTSEEALRSVPLELSMASYALGASKVRTIMDVCLPFASQGILGGVVLGTGRAIGETAALLFTLGSNLALIKNANSPARVLSVHLYLLIRENISMSNAFISASILVLLVLLFNRVTSSLFSGVGTGRR